MGFLEGVILKGVQLNTLLGYTLKLQKIFQPDFTPNYIMYIMS